MAHYEAETTNKFSALSGLVSDEILKAVDNMGFIDMTDIQKKCIPKLIEGIDIRGTAKTGSGKTLAFLIPVVEHMKRENFSLSKGTGAVIIAPTRELAMQIYSVLKDLLVEDNSITYGTVMGGTNRSAEASKIKIGVNIIVATPGRLLDHLLNTTKFRFRNLKLLVIDEADRILDIGFEKDIKQIIRLLPKTRQTMLFSATKSQKIEDLAKLALKTSLLDVDVDVDKIDATVDGLHQSYLICPTEKRFLVLYSFLKRNKKKKIMVFFSTCHAVKFYTELFVYIDLPITGIHGKQKQSKRTSTFFEFIKAESGTLFCTDVAARGLDIQGVDWIVQYDPPDDPKEYIHRVGRTARAGGNGNALLILRQEEIGFIRYLKANKVNVDSIDIVWSKVANIQLQFQKLITTNYLLSMSAKKAFKSYLRAYMSHQLKDVFDPDEIDIKKTATCFGFSVAPSIDIGSMKQGGKNSRRFKKYEPYRNKKSKNSFVRMEK